MVTGIVVSWGVAFLGLRTYRTYQRKQGWKQLLASGAETSETEADTSLVLVPSEPDRRRDVALTVLTAGTAFVHLQIGLTAGVTLFTLNGAGFLGLLGLYYLPQAQGYRDLTRDALMTYSGVTFVSYFSINGLVAGLAYLPGLATAIAEAGIIGLLIADSPRVEFLPEPDDNVVIIESSSEPAPEPAPAAA